MYKTINDLPLGAKIKHPGMKYSGKPITFIKVTHDGHYTPGETIFITEDLISSKAFDAKEPKNSDADRAKYGNNNYELSNIEQWLNSKDKNWYSARHSSDQAPTSDYVSSRAYLHEAGFLYNFTDEALNNIKDTTIVTAKHSLDGGGTNTLKRKIFLMSRTEACLGNEFSEEPEGKPFPYFTTKERRQKSNSYWLRTPRSAFTNTVRRVHPDGSLDSYFVHSGTHGIRPALSLSSSVLIYKQDNDGVYEIVLSNLPTITGKDEDLGDVYNNLKYKYTVSNKDSEKLFITEKLNSKILNKYEDVNSDTSFEFIISEENFKKLEADTEHTIEIIVSSKRYEVIRTIVFTKVMEPSNIIIPNNLGEVYDIDINYTITGYYDTDIEIVLEDKVLFKKENIEKNKKHNFKYDISRLPLNKEYFLNVITTTQESREIKKIRFTKKTKTHSIALYKDNETNQYKDYAVKYLTDGIDKLSFNDLKMIKDSIGNLNNLNTDNKKTLVDAINETHNKGRKPVGDVINLEVKLQNSNNVAITWQDPEDITLQNSANQKIIYTKWYKTAVVRKQGKRSSKNINDGTVILETYNANQHINEPFIDSTTIEGQTYTYTLFTVSDSGGVSKGKHQTIKTDLSIFGFEIDENIVNPQTAITYIGENEGYTPMKNNDFGDWEDFVKDMSTPVLLKSGRVQYKLQYDDFTKKEDGSKSTLTGEDGDVMIRFKHLWVKEEHVSDKKRKIWLSHKPVEGFISLSKKVEKGYNILNWGLLVTLQNLFLLLYKNRNSQEALGKGYVNDPDKNGIYETGKLNTSSFSYGTQNDTEPIKFLGMESLWGNMHTWIDGVRTDDNRDLLIAYGGFNQNGDGYKKIPLPHIQNTTGYPLETMGGEGGFIIKKGEGSSSTGYTDFARIKDDCILNFGGDYYGGDNAGMFFLSFNDPVYAQGPNHGARLVYVDEDYFYVSVYDGFLDGGRLRSVSGKKPTGSQPIRTLREAAQANN